MDGAWKPCKQAESVFIKVSGFLTVKNYTAETRPYIPPKIRNILIERAPDFHTGVQELKTL